MNVDRRRFLETSLAAGALLAAQREGRAWLSQEKTAAKPLHVLVLGGTQFLGPHIVDALKARGHTITLFNRGRTRPDWYPELEKLRGDRDPDKGEGIKALEGRKFDAVIDDCGYYPRMVKASAALLAPNVGFYVFVSSISVYAKNDVPDADESAAVGTIPDETVETMGADFANYGPLKALCEQAAEKALPGRVANVRPGYIVGPLDPSDRFTYWPVRVKKGGEMIAPGHAEDPIQVIDARDLAGWIVKLVEGRKAGVYNATGPASPIPMGRLLESCKKVAASDARFTWVESDFLQQHQVGFPIWIPPVGEYAGFHKVNCKRAVGTGLTYRSIEETIKDTLAWFEGEPEERRQGLWQKNLAEAKELEVLEAWKKRS